MNRTEAMKHMLEGKTVQALNGIYLRLTDLPRYRWKDHQLEWQYLGRDWNFSRNSFYLCWEFEVYKGETK